MKSMGALTSFREDLHLLSSRGQIFLPGHCNCVLRCAKLRDNVHTHTNKTPFFGAPAYGLAYFLP
jgi:hypothetical protein